MLASFFGTHQPRAAQLQPPPGGGGSKRAAGNGASANSAFASQNIYQAPRDWPSTLAKIVVTVAATVALLMLLSVVEDWLTEPCTPEDEKDPDRCTRLRRTATFGSALMAFARTLVTLGGFIVVLHHAGLRTTTLFTLASILSLVVGLAAQRVLQDVFAGMVFLAEGQLLNGDFVQLTTTCGNTPIGGIVENVSLRRIKLRNFENEVIYVPNSEVRAMSNSSQRFPVVRLRILISRTADSSAVLAALQAVAESLGQDEDFRAFMPPGTDGLGAAAAAEESGEEGGAGSEAIISTRLLRSLDAVGMTGPEPEVQGVSDVAAGGFEVLFRFMSDIGKQWSAGRYARQKLIEALEPFGPVAQVVRVTQV